MDEQHPLYPQTSYALSKVLSEEMARQFSRVSGKTQIDGILQCAPTTFPLYHLSLTFLQEDR